MLNHLALKLDRVDETYIAGSTVSGKIVVNNATPLNLLQLTLTFRGEIHTRWTNKTADNVYESVDYPLNTTVSLNDYTGVFGGQMGLLEAPFRFVLPRHLPSSFYNEYYGWIAYVIEGVITVMDPNQNGPGCIGGQVERQFNTDKPFRVIGSLDLSRDRPDLMRPVQVEDSVEIIGCCRSKGIVRAHLDLPSGGFMSDQVISADLKLQASKASLGSNSSISLSLCQQLQFTAQSLYTMNYFDQKEHMLTLCTVKGRNVKSSTKEHCDTLQLHIPKQCLPSTPSNQQFICINYFLKLDACGLDILIPILIASSNQNN